MDLYRIVSSVLITLIFFVTFNEALICYDCINCEKVTEKTPQQECETTLRPDYKCGQHTSDNNTIRMCVQKAMCNDGIMCCDKDLCNDKNGAIPLNYLYVYILTPIITFYVHRL